MIDQKKSKYLCNKLQPLDLFIRICWLQLKRHHVQLGASYLKNSYSVLLQVICQKLLDRDGFSSFIFSMQIELQSTFFSAYEHLIESEPRLFEMHLYYDLHALDLENVWKCLGSGDRSRPLGVNEKKNHCQSYRWVGMCKKSILLLILTYDLF